MTKHAPLKFSTSVAIMASLAACSSDPAPNPFDPGSTGAPFETTGTSVASTGGLPASTAGTTGAPISTTGDLVATTGDVSPTTSSTGGEFPGTTGAPGTTAGDGGTEPPGSGTTTGAGANEWVQMAYDVASTYHNPLETTLTKENAAQLDIAYRKDLGSNVYGAPLQVGDRIYASSEVVVMALDAATGDQIWRNTRAATSGSLAYDHDTNLLFMHTDAGDIAALDAETGDVKWEEAAGPTETDGSSSPLVAGGQLFIGGSNGRIELGGGSFRGFLSALNPADGSLLWSTFTVPEGSQGASIWSTISVDLDAGLVYAGTGNNYGRPNTDTSDAIVAFDFAGGEIKWKNQRTVGDTWRLTSPTGPDAAFGANRVLYDIEIDGVMTPMVSGGQKSGDIHGLRRDTGEQVWTRSLGGGSSNGSSGVFVNASWSGKHMMFAENNGGRGATLFGIDGAKGDTVWQTDLPGPVFGRISSANGVGFVGAGAQMVIFDTDTGTIIKMIPSEGNATVTGTVTIVNGRVAYGEGMSWSGSTPGSTLTVLEIK